MDTKKLRQKILDLAIRGKLVPQAPNDEPASVLLERIRAEKERLIKEGKIKRGKKSEADTPNDENEFPFEIPECWEWVRLGALCNVVRGGSPRPAGSKEFYEGPIPFLKVADLTRDDCIYVNKAQSSIKEAGLTKTRLIKANTLLLTNSGATLGVPKINTFETAINDGIAAFLYLSSDIQMFIYWYLKSKTNSFRQIDQGAAQPNLNTDILSAENIPLPPLSEQHRIVAAVEQWFALIDILENAKDDLQTSIAKAKSKILDLAIHGKLVPQDPNDEPAIELLKRINPKFKPCEDADCPYELPENWEWTKLGDISNYGNVTTESVENISDNSWILELEDIEKDSAKVIQFLRKKERGIKGVRHLFNKNDILYSKLRTYLNKVLMANETGYCTTEIIPITVCQDVFTNYVCHVLRSPYFLDYTEQCGYGVKMPRLSTNDARKGFIPLPPYPEQLRIVAKIEELFAELDKIKESIEA